MGSEFEWFFFALYRQSKKMAQLLRLTDLTIFLRKLVTEIEEKCNIFAHALEGHGTTYDEELRYIQHALRYLEGNFIPETEEEKQAVQVYILDYTGKKASEEHNIFHELEFAISMMIEWAGHYKGTCDKRIKAISALQRATRRSLLRAPEGKEESKRLY